MDDVLAMCGVERVRIRTAKRSASSSGNGAAERGAIDELDDQIIRSDGSSWQIWG